MRDGYSREELDAAGLLDFRVFLCHVWDYLGLPPPTPVQLDIAYNLQHGPRRFILQAFRGVGKSWITVAFVCWLWLGDPQLKIMVVSANAEAADAFSKFVKQIIHGMPVLQHLIPRYGQKDSGISFDVGPARASKDPSQKSVGITGQLTGSRADVIIADDVEVPRNSFTHGLREKLSDSVKEFDALLKPNGRVVYLGTPQTEATLYNRLTKRGYEILIWPAEIPKSIEAYHGRLAQFVVSRMERGAKAGDPVDPKRFNLEDLAERRLSYGDADYALQFMLDTNPSDAEKNPLKLADLLVLDVDPDLSPVKLVWGREKQHQIQDISCGGLDGDTLYGPVWRSPEMTNYSGTVMAVDPSGMGADETAYSIVRYAHGQLFWVASGGFKNGFDESTLMALAAAAARHKVTVYVDETNYGGGMFTNLMTPHLRRVGITKINPEEEWDGWSRGQKELRILDTLEPLVKSHKLCIDRQVLLDDATQQAKDSKYSVVQQFTRMARVKGALANEDRLESLAMACRYWTALMDRDTELLYKKHQESLIDDAIREFLRDTGGSGLARKWHPRYQGNRR